MEMPIVSPFLIEVPEPFEEPRVAVPPPQAAIPINIETLANPAIIIFDNFIIPFSLKVHWW
jgi:hypothetical protein